MHLDKLRMHSVDTSCCFVGEASGKHTWEHQSIALNAFEMMGQWCSYCLQSPCVIVDPAKPTSLFACGEVSARNISKQYRDYKQFYKMLKTKRLWSNEEYTTWKFELGIYVENVHKVMPNCIFADVRKRWPNPDKIPYKCHIPTMLREWKKQ